MSPSHNTVRPAVGLKGGEIRGEFRGDHALAKGKARRSRTRPRR